MLPPMESPFPFRPLLIAVLTLGALWVLYGALLLLWKVVSGRPWH